MEAPKRILEISTVVGCSLGCPYCPQKIHVQNYAAVSTEFSMSLDTYMRCLSQVPTSVEIMFAGMAEPWHNANCTQMVLKAHEHGHSVAAFTTGAGWRHEAVAQLKHIPFRIFCVHLPDAEGRMHLNVTPYYLETLLLFKKHMPMVTWMCVGQLHQLVRNVLGFDVTDGSPALISRAGTVPGITPSAKKGRLKKLPCMEHNVLLPNGDVVLCCMDYAQKSTLGNLLVDQYEDLFHGHEFKRIEAGLKDETIDIICRKCEVAECEA